MTPSRQSKSLSKKSPSKKKTLREIAIKYFQQKELRNFFENPKNMDRHDAISQMLFRASLHISQKYNKKIEQYKFFQTLFSLLKEEKLSEEETKEAYNTFVESLSFEKVQELRVNLLYYLHHYPKGNAVPTVSYKTILEQMIKHGVTNNKKFLMEGTRFIETLTDDIIYHGKLSDIVSAFLFGTHQEYAEKKENKIKNNVSREKLLKELKDCREKVRKLSGL